MKQEEKLIPTKNQSPYHFPHTQYDFCAPLNSSHHPQLQHTLTKSKPLYNITNNTPSIPKQTLTQSQFKCLTFIFGLSQNEFIFLYVVSSPIPTCYMASLKLRDLRYYTHLE